MIVINPDYPKYSRMWEGGRLKKDLPPGKEPIPNRPELSLAKAFFIFPVKENIDAASDDPQR